MILKRYDELKKGDKIWFHGYKAFVRDVKETGIVTDKNNVYHFGERIFALNIGFEPSPDGIEKQHITVILLIMEELLVVLQK